MEKANAEMNRDIARDMLIFSSEDQKMAKYYNESRRKSSQKYMLKNCYSIAFRLSKVYEEDLIEIYHSIPKSQKAAWFKECLREYAEKHPIAEQTEEVSD